MATNWGMVGLDFLRRGPNCERFNLEFPRRRGTNCERFTNLKFPRRMLSRRGDLILW